MKKHTVSTFTKHTACATLLLAVSMVASLAGDNNPTVVKVGSASVKLVAPENYIDCSGENDQVRNFAENFCPPNNRLLGVFGSPEFRRNALAGESSASFDYALVEISRGTIWRDASLSDFEEVRSSLKREQKSLFAEAKPDIKEAINRINSNLQNATGERVSFNLEQPVPLGVFDDGAHHVSLMMLMQMQVKTGSHVEQSKVAASITLIHLKNKVVFVYVYRAYSGDESVKSLKKFTSDWMAKLEKTNE